MAWCFSPSSFIRLLLLFVFLKKVYFQAFRHLYVLATEARWIQTVDVDTGLPVYAPLEVTTRETEHYAETSFCEVTPCLLPERAVVSFIISRICIIPHLPLRCFLSIKIGIFWGHCWPCMNQFIMRTTLSFIKRTGAIMGLFSFGTHLIVSFAFHFP